MKNFLGVYRMKYLKNLVLMIFISTVFFSSDGEISDFSDIDWSRSQLQPFQC